MAMSTAAPPLVGRPERKSSASSLNDAKITKKAAQHGTTSDKSKKLSSAAAASSSTAIAVAVLKIRDKRDVVEEMVRVTPTRKMHEISLDRKMGMGEKLMYTNMGKQSQSRGISKMFRMFKGDSRKRTRREAQEIEDTAPIVSDVPTEIITEEMRMLSQKVQNNLSGGGRSPSIDESVTVPYDSEDFQ